MYQRYYDGYGDVNAVQTPEEPIQNETFSNEICVADNEIQIAKKNDGILGSLKLDDILLIGILIVMLSDDCDDKLMLIIIGFLFVSGLN